MIRRIKQCAAVALALTLPLVACEDSTTEVDNGRISILLTDAAGDFEAAVVTISEIYLQGEGEGEAEGAADGRVVLRDDPVTTDLLTLANDVETLVEDAVIPSGTYAQLRFVIEGGYVAVENSAGEVEVFVTEGYEPPSGFDFPEGSEVVGTLECPSCSQSGLKVNLSAGAVTVEGDEQVLLADFDVTQSFGKEAGNSGKWVMKPVIKAAGMGQAASVHATVRLGEGVTLPVIDAVQLTLADFKVTLTNDAGSTEEASLTDEDEDGVFEAEFEFLLPGSYDLGLAVVSGLTIATNPALPLPLDVEAGAEVEADVIVTSASGS